MRKDAARWDSQQSDFWVSHFMQRRMFVYSCLFLPPSIFPEGLLDLVSLAVCCWASSGPARD